MGKLSPECCDETPDTPPNPFRMTSGADRGVVRIAASLPISERQSAGHLSLGVDPSFEGFDRDLPKMGMRVTRSSALLR
jgi:hypothetical protein